MCMNCGSAWPWAHHARPTKIYDPPVKEETIYLEPNTGFYQDQRKGFHPPGRIMPTWNAGYYGAGYPQYGQYGLPGYGQYGMPGYNQYYPMQAQAGMHFGYPFSSYQSPFPIYPSYNAYNLSYNPYNLYNWLTSQQAAAPGGFNWHQPNFYHQYYQNYSRMMPGQNPWQYMSYMQPGGPMSWGAATTPDMRYALAGMAAANNAAIAQMGQAPNYYVGGPMDYAAQQAYLVGQMGFAKPPPTQVAPYKPADGQQFWVKEVDGSWTLRTHSDIISGDLDPGHWDRHPASGYLFFIRDG